MELLQNIIDSPLDSGDAKPSKGFPIPSDRSTIIRLIEAAALMLFLELALIRWLGSNVVHLSYFSNFVLLGSFLGIGAGFLISRKSWSIWPISLPLLTILVGGILTFPVSIERAGDDIIYFTSLKVSGPPTWVVLPLVFTLTAVVLAGPAELVGRCFAKLPPLTAYRYDLVGSLLGIVGFTALSFLQAPSIVWGIIAVVIFTILSDVKRRIVSMAWGAALVLMLGMETFTPGVSWSPYYKITTSAAEDAGYKLTRIDANGVPHQLMAPAQWKMEQGEHIYEAPYLRLPTNKLQDVLIIGAGSGSDVAIALRKGAQNIDAVDIDPRIMEIGAQFNVDQPYSDPRVRRHVNDGRAFLESTDKKYDLILFALPDSLTLVSGASQIRLESFLFTEEAMASVRRRLKPHGAFAMYNYYRENWLIDRLARTTSSAFGHMPCLDTFAGAQAVISIAVDANDQNCSSAPTHSTGIRVPPANDNAPFLYFRGDTFPPFYTITLVSILTLTFLTVRLLGGPISHMRPYWDLFFMGAAFLLLETKNVATFALLFGTTWLVNALVFGGVLLIVLAAVETTRRFRTPSLPVIFSAIIASLLLAWLIRPEWLLPLPFLPRLIAATLLAFLPIYLANIAFAKRFENAGDSRSAFAINLMGTIVGGCLEYSALLTGYNNLLLLTGLLYLIAFILVPKAHGRAI